MTGLIRRFLVFRKKPPKDTAGLDQHVVKQLRSIGADLSRPRNVRHFVYFQDEAQAREAAKQIEKTDYTATVTSPSDQVPYWTVRAEGNRVISEATVPGFRAWFEQVAAEYGGEYDGWEPATKP
jgi:hypothetical protein